MANLIHLMTATRAVGILDGRITWSEPVEYLEAALYASLHLDQCRPLMAAALYAVALKVADYAVDYGEEAACHLISEAQRTKP